MTGIKELRVGAHIERRGNREKVVSLVAIDEDSQPVIGTKAASSLPADVSPIPLTAALLAELGFEPVRKALGRDDEEWRMELDGYPIKVTKGLSAHPDRDWSVHIDNWDYDTLGAADVAYLHQLENIIYLCTGRELVTKEAE